MSEPLNGRAGKVAGSPHWLAPVGLIVVLAVAAGWFLMSWALMGTSVPDALGEAVGVAFGLLIVVSVIGAVRNRPHRG